MRSAAKALYIAVMLLMALLPIQSEGAADETLSAPSRRHN